MTGSNEYKGLLVVIPTRNRASLAKNAIRSVISQDVSGVELLVSDNSTEAEELETLRKYCEELGHPHLTYVRPPEPLPMSAHWDWAIQGALASQKNHFVYLTDRMMFKRDELGPLVNVVANYPDDIISYNHDRIVDDANPIRIEQLPGSGKLLKLETLRLSHLYSQIELHYCLPRMLNCVAPRQLLETMRTRFGSVFASIAPDFCFCCRCFEMVESLVFYDRSPIFHYALKRSNGASLTRGELTQDHADFAASVGMDRLTQETPFPEILTTGSIIFNEYCRVARATGSSRFFELNREKYLDYLAQEVDKIENQALRAGLNQALLKRGRQTAAHAGEKPVKRTVVGLVKKVFSPRRAYAKIGWLMRSSVAKPIWIFLARLTRTSPPFDQRFEFDQTNEAIDYLNEFPSRESETTTWSEEKFQPEFLPTTSAIEQRLERVPGSLRVKQSAQP